MAPSVGLWESFKGPDRRRDHLPPGSHPHPLICQGLGQSFWGGKNPRPWCSARFGAGCSLYPSLFLSISLWISERKQVISTDGWAWVWSSLSPLWLEQWCPFHWHCSQLEEQLGLQTPSFGGQRQSRWPPLSWGGTGCGTSVCPALMSLVLSTPLSPLTVRRHFVAGAV